MRNEKTYFEKRIGRFGRVRRSLANAVLAYAEGVMALSVGIASLFLLSGWTANPFVNVAIALAALCVLAWLLIRLGIRWERRRRVLSAAFRLEELAGDLNSRVISAVDFLEWPEPTPLTEEVVRLARQDLERPFEQMLDRIVRNRLRTRFVLLLVFFLILGATDRFGFARMVHTVHTSARHLQEILFPTRFEVFPGSGEYVYLVGSEVEAGIRFTRFGYPEVTMLRATDGEEEERTVLPVDTAGRAAVTLQPALEAEYRIRFAFGPRTTEEMKLVFTALPMIENMQTELVYPLYTRLMPKETEGIQDRITALPGTRVSMGFSFSKALNWAVLTFDDGERMPLDVVGRFGSISFMHALERRAALQVEDIHGFALAAPHAVEFSLTADNPPRLIVPKYLKLDMPCLIGDFGGFGFGVRVEDDFGAAKCVFTWRKSTTEDKGSAKKGEPMERSFIPPRPKAVAAFENIFSEQPAEPGDLFTFQVEAFDNRQPKPQSVVSALFSIFIHQADLTGRILGGGIDLLGRFRSRSRGIRQYETPDDRGGIAMPEAIARPEMVRNEYDGTRGTETRAEVRGPNERTAVEYFTGGSEAGE